MIRRFIGDMIAYSLAVALAVGLVAGMVGMSAAERIAGRK